MSPGRNPRRQTYFLLSNKEVNDERSSLEHAYNAGGNTPVLSTSPVSFTHSTTASNSSQSSLLEPSGSIHQDYSAVPLSNSSRFCTILPWIVHALLLTTYTTIFFLFTLQLTPRHGPQSPYSSPAFHLSLRKHTTYFDKGWGTTNHTTNERTIYAGPPSAAIDAAWATLEKASYIHLTAHEAQKLNYPTAELYGAYEGSYLSGLDVFHQLHCLNYIRQALYPEYYRKADPHNIIFNPNHEQHLGHCVNTLRQALMCTGDLTPVPFEKVVREGRTAYKAVFERVEHKCNGEFAEYYGWSMERKVSTKAEGFELNIL